MELTLTEEEIIEALETEQGVRILGMQWFDIAEG